MNDFDFDVAQKKRIARGAYNRKGGSRSKKCTLPDDSLTPAQRAKLSKTLVSVNLKAPMTLAQFKLLPTDIKREYLEWLHNEIGVTAASISKDMFKMERNYLGIYLRRFEPGLLGIFADGRGRKMSEAAVKRWREFLGEPEPEESTPEPEAQEEPEPIAEEPVLTESTEETVSEVFKECRKNAQTLAAAFTPTTLSASYEGELYEADLNAIIHLLAGDRCVKGITLNIKF